MIGGLTESNLQRTRAEQTTIASIDDMRVSLKQLQTDQCESLEEARKVLRECDNIRALFAGEISSIEQRVCTVQLLAVY